MALANKLWYVHPKDYFAASRNHAVNISRHNILNKDYYAYVQHGLTKNKQV